MEGMLIETKTLIRVVIMSSFLLLPGCGSSSSPASAPIVTSSHTYVGSVNSSIYHYPSCRSAQKIKEANEVWFSDASDAESAGYVPCKVCKPPSN